MAKSNQKHDEEFKAYKDTKAALVKALAMAERLMDQTGNGCAERCRDEIEDAIREINSFAVEFEYTKD